MGLTPNPNIPALLVGAVFAIGWLVICIDIAHDMWVDWKKDRKWRRHQH